MWDECERPTTWQRCEAKYLISERQAAAVRRYCLDHIPPDPYTVHRLRNTYPILSVYFDSPSRQLLRDAVHRQPYRYKLRVRSYCDHEEWMPGKPAFVEIKRKVYGVVHKTRTKVTPTVTTSLLNDGQALVNGDGLRELCCDMTVNEFLQLGCRIAAKPIIGVFYQREAYEGHSIERVRITLDRSLHCGLLIKTSRGLQGLWWPVPAVGVILEVKFTNTYPFWVSNMLHRGELLRRGVCKYTICSRAAGMSSFRAVGAERSKV
jgi:hypothetical protein